MKNNQLQNKNKNKKKLENNFLKNKRKIWEMNNKQGKREVKLDKIKQEDK